MIQTLYWLVLMVGASVTVSPVPFQSIETCEAAAASFHDQSGARTQWGNCIAQPADDVREFHSNLLGPAYD